MLIYEFDTILIDLRYIFDWFMSFLLENFFPTKVAVHDFCMLCVSTKVIRDDTPITIDLMNY